MASLGLGAASLFRAIAPFAGFLKSAPHRDATHIPYAQWLSLYVESLGKGPANRAISDEEKVEKVLFLQQYHDVVDAMLLSSLLAPKWNQVLVPSNLNELEGVLEIQAGKSEKMGKGRNPTHLEPAREDLWYLNTRKDRLTSSTSTADRFYGVEAGDEDENAEMVEVFTPKFLTEPLLGGSCLSYWTEELRRQAAWLRSSRDDNAIPPGGDRAIHLTIPFTCLWQIKHEAHLRPGLSNAPSLQERYARQSLLQALHHAFQMQADLNRLSSPARGRGWSIELHLSRPTEEFAMLCELPRVRDRFLAHDDANRPSRTGQTHRTLSLATLCEQTTARLAYFTRYSLYRRSCTRNAAATTKKTEKEEDANPSKGRPSAHEMMDGRSRVCLVVHPSEQRLFRALQVPALCGSSLSISARQQRAIKEAQRPSTHKKALLGCGEMVRRMTTREETLRQSTMTR